MAPHVSGAISLTTLMLQNQARQLSPVFSFRFLLAAFALFASSACYLSPDKVDPWTELPSIKYVENEGERPPIAVEIESEEGADLIPDDLFSKGRDNRDTPMVQRLKATIELAMEESGAFLVTTGAGSAQHLDPEYTFKFSVKEMRVETTADKPWYERWMYWFSLQPLRGIAVIRATVTDFNGREVGDDIEERGEDALRRGNLEFQVEDHLAMQDSFDKRRPAALANATQKCIHKLIYSAATQIIGEDTEATTNEVE